MKNQRIEAIQSAIQAFQSYDLSHQDMLDILIILIGTWVKIHCEDAETTEKVIESIHEGLKTIVYSPEIRLN